MHVPPGRGLELLINPLHSSSLSNYKLAAPAQRPTLT